jgi:hypothetical protein
MLLVWRKVGEGFAGAKHRRSQARDSGLKGGREVVVSPLADRDAARVVGSLRIDSSG